MANVELKPVSQQVAVIFGASSGIGRATALEFARKGAKLIVVGRKEMALASLVEEIQALGSDGVAMAADTAHFDEVEAVAREAARRFGRIDSWIHVAGVGIYSRFTELTPREFDQTIRVNLLGQAYGAMVAIPHLKRNPGGGALILVSSIVSQVPFPLLSAYAASKHGMKGFIDTMRIELKHDGVPVSVTNIMPAVIDTPFYQHAKTKLGVQPKVVPPVYSPEKVAAAIVRAAEHPKRDVVVGASGHFLIWSKRLFSPLYDWVLSKVGITPQYSNLPKSPDAPSELFAAETPDAAIHGGWKNDKDKEAA